MITLINGDCLEKMKYIEDNSVDLVFTSPPYANRRKNCYNSIHEDDYVEWFKPIATEIKRIMKPTGSFFLNIKTHTDKGERSLYVMELIIALKKEIELKFVDEFCWIKQAFPGSYNGRFKNGFEPVYHFTKYNPSDITFNPIACGTPIKPESIARAYRKQSGSPANGSGMTAMNTTNIRYLKTARPSNVVHANNISNQHSDKQKHPATFPESLVEFFVKSFTNEGDIVLDPFMGSGTTGIVAKNLERSFIGIELDKYYYDISKDRIDSTNVLQDVFGK